MKEVKMERKIGEIFEDRGYWYQCLESSSCRCDYCDYGELGDCHKIACPSGERSDDKEVYFKKLEKVGEPHFIEDEIFEGGKVYVQNFKVYKKFEGHKPICNDYIIYDWKNRIISIEIKQKENMEEKKLNLKPFDIQKAREGKPVCTRDGRKVRIICFDYKGDANAYPILALISTSNLSGVPSEIIAKYTEDGRYTKYNDVENDEDLMMLPEKKEGWVNVYKGGLFDTKSYPTKKEAFDKACPVDYVDTVKVCWKE